MSNQVRVITPPDIIFSSVFKVLLLDLDYELTKSFESALMGSNGSVDVYQCTATPVDIKWVLSVASLVDQVFIDIDNISPEIAPFLSYLISMPHVYYRDTHNKTPWNLLSQNRIFDIPNLNT